MSATGWPAFSPTPLLPPEEPRQPAPPVPPDAGRGELILPVAVARLLAFAPLAILAALDWARMVAPAASAQLMACVVAAMAAGGALAALARRAPRARVRAAATLLAALALLLLGFTVAGVPLRLLDPRAWDDLAGGIGQGLGTVPTVRVPYSGLDEWTRTVLVLGGALLAGTAALLAFAPRRDGALGFPVAAAVALGVLYAVPVIQTEIERPFLAGLAFALLLGVFLWLERVERRSIALACCVVAGACLAAFVAAPRVDGDRALLDYEEIAQSLSPATATTYDWNHGYGPLDWPRDGREVLRVAAPQRSYWKAANLTAFDGVRWLQAPGRDDRAIDTPLQDRWQQTIRVTVRALRSSKFVAAGTALEITKSPRAWVRSGPGLFETQGRPLRRGHAYRALVYTPRPTPLRMRAAGTRYPAQLAGQYGAIGLPPRITGTQQPFALVPSWGREDPAADARLRDSPYAGAYALARRLKARSANPYEFMRAIERRLATGDFSYSERPPASRAPLEDFLLRDRVGYCQQFSGAMALLLRMGGVPARVSAGFAPGIIDSERREYVVRDIDAHSWVEVYFPGIGWVTRDPTPAASPARSQTADEGTGGGDAPAAIGGGSERGLGGSTDVGPAGASPGAAEDPGPSALTYVLAGLGTTAAFALALALALLVRRRRRGPPLPAGDAGGSQLAELLRALRRSGRTPPPQTTLQMLARRYSGSPAAGYVQRLQDARYGYGDAGRPSRGERAALRRELGAGLGVRGRARAWWALPPRPGRRRDERRRARPRASRRAATTVRRR